MHKSAPPSLSSVSEYASESSKTDSNASKLTDIQEEQNVDHGELTPIDMECHIQADRITKSLDKLVFQTKLALCLPTLICDPIFASILNEQHLFEVSTICQQYDKPLFSASILNMAAMEDIRNGDMSLKHRLNPELGFMMYTLSAYPQLKPRVEMITNAIKDKFQGMVHQVLPPGLAYLLKVEELRDLMVVQMTNSAAMELGLKIRTRKLEESNTKELDKIAEYSKYIRDEKEHFENEMAKRAVTIAELRQELALFDHKTLVKRKKQILDSERQMVLATRSHNVKFKMLQEEEVEARDNYDIMLHRHMIAEKNLRLRRSKVETQLQSWLQKYDTEMNVKQEDLDELNKKYEDELELKEKLEIDLAEQDKEYLPLMEEREKEYHAEMEEKYKLFLIEHAARVIQVAWRTTLSNRAEKKKLKKLLKKMEAEREAAEKKAEIEARKAAAEEKRRAAAAKKAEKEAAKQAKLEAKAAKAAAAAESGKSK